MADDTVGVAILTSRQGPSFDDHLREFPLWQHDSPGRRAVRPRGVAIAAARFQPAPGRVMLVGDAAGYVDALTGEGLGIALGCAELAVNAVLTDDPADYTQQWRRMSRRYRLLTSAP